MDQHCWLCFVFFHEMFAEVLLTYCTYCYTSPAQSAPMQSRTCRTNRLRLTEAPLYSYVKGKPAISDPRFFDRLKWNGSNHTEDLQDGSIVILNVTFNDTGTYKCIFKRTLKYSNFEFQTSSNKTVVVKVVPKFTRGLASILSEVMMYVSIVGLQVWLVIEMVYCYRKISAAGEEALRESAAEYLAVAPESKDPVAGVQVAE
uniref:Sodium channel, voltage-gated, type I, beta a n=1 Tax=Gasterosteus aculeatus aculeatus TaxID=481459 RepID=A0AAQ4RG78_GASAC